MLKVILFSLGLGLILGLLIAIFNRFIKTPSEDPIVNQVYEVLPHNDCGGCGYPNCKAFAKAVVKDNSLVNGCVVGGQETANKMAHIFGITRKKAIKKFAVVKCSGGINTKDSFLYEGIKSCKAALQLGYPKQCTYGCVGLGDCVSACDFDAIKIGEKGLPVVNKERCTGCGKCVEACPQNLIELHSKNDKVALLCNSHDPPNIKIKVCSSACMGCGLCAQVCSQKAIEMKDGLPVINQQLCDGCGLCIKKCPKHVLEFV